MNSKLNAINQIKLARQGNVNRIDQEKKRMNEIDNEYEEKNRKRLGIGMEVDDNDDDFIVNDEDDYKKKYHEAYDNEDIEDSFIDKEETRKRGKKEKEGKDGKENQKVTNKMKKLGEDVLNDIFASLDEDHTYDNRNRQTDRKLNIKPGMSMINPQFAPNTFSNYHQNNENTKQNERKEDLTTSAIESLIKKNDIYSDILTSSQTINEEADLKTDIQKERVVEKFSKKNVIRTNQKRIKLDDDEENEEMIKNNHMMDVDENENIDGIRQISIKRNTFAPDSNSNEKSKLLNDRVLSITPTKENSSNTRTSLIDSSLNQSSAISLRNATSNDPIPLNSDNNLLFFWYDAHEEPSSKTSPEPKVILFGKVKEAKQEVYSSISVVLTNLKKTIFLFPKKNSLGEYYDTFDMYKEFEAIRKTKLTYIESFTSEVVEKKYAFELPIEHTQLHTVLKIKYDAKFGCIPETIQGQTFSYIFGNRSSLLESVLIKLKLKGPSWIELNVNDFSKNMSCFTWSKYEVLVKDYKKIIVNKANLPTPPLKILSLGIKGVSVHGGAKEIVSISCFVKEKYYLDSEKDFENDKDLLTIILSRKIKNLDVNTLSFRDQVKNQNATVCNNEVSLLNLFIQKLSNIDPDFIVSHGLYTNQLDILLSRINKLKISNWSKLSKMKREVFPKFLQSNNTTYIRTCTIGRLLCDTLISCRDIIKENNYDIDYLSEKYLKMSYKEIDMNNLIEHLNENNLSSTRRCFKGNA